MRQVMRRSVRRGLTKDRILEESRALVDIGGEAALTMRALSARLGVAPMALYNHFHDRDAILDALADSVFEQMRQSALEPRTPARGVGGWQRRLKTLLMCGQKLAAQHPQVFRLAFTRPTKPPSAFALAADAISTLRKAGLSEAECLTAYHTFVLLLQGYPFWHEGMLQHGLGREALPGATGSDCLPMQLLPGNWTMEQQFEAIVDWLLGCVAALKNKRKTTPRRR